MSAVDAARALCFGPIHPLLQACAAVDRLTQQIGVADVAGILLDQMDDDVAHLHFPPAQHPWRNGPS